MLIPWLLKGDGYPPGVVVALLLHGFLLYVFMPKDFDPADRVTIQPMSYVVASMATQSPQKLRRLEQQNTQQRNAEAREQQRRADQQRQEQERQRVADQQRAEEQQRVADRQRREEQQRVAEQQRREEEQRVAEQRRQAEQQRVADQQAAEEAARISAAREAQNAQQLSAEDQLVSQYVGIIHDLISGAWRIPPAARNGMLAIVDLRLTPTGDIISRTISQSSGNADFDRSVLEAVDRVGSFPELKDMPSGLFDRQFRAGIDLEFSPEDLLR